MANACPGQTTIAQSQRAHPDDMLPGGFHDPETARFVAECGACGKTVEMTTKPVRDGRIIPAADCPFTSPANAAAARAEEERLGRAFLDVVKEG